MIQSIVRNLAKRNLPQKVKKSNRVLLEENSSFKHGLIHTVSTRGGEKRCNAKPKDTSPTLLQKKGVCLGFFQQTPSPARKFPKISNQKKSGGAACKDPPVNHQNTSLKKRDHLKKLVSERRT